MRYPWPRYSKQEDGGYCLPCVLFKEVQTFVLMLECLSATFSPTLRMHKQKVYHKEAVVKIVKVMSDQQDTISVQIMQPRILGTGRSNH